MSFLLPSFYPLWRNVSNVRLVAVSNVLEQLHWGQSKYAMGSTWALSTRCALKFQPSFRNEACAHGFTARRVGPRTSSLVPPRVW